MESENRPSSVLKSVTSVGNLKGAPVPSTLEALSQTADTGFWTLCCHGCLDRLCAGAAVAGALAVATAQAKVLPLAERAVAAVTGTMPLALRMEASKLIKTNLLGGILSAEDAAAFPAMMAAVEKAEWCLARGRRACWSGAVRLERLVSTIGLERFAALTESPMDPVI